MSEIALMAILSAARIVAADPVLYEDYNPALYGKTAECVARSQHIEEYCLEHQIAVPAGQHLLAAAEVAAFGFDKTQTPAQRVAAVRAFERHIEAVEDALEASTDFRRLEVPNA